MTDVADALKGMTRRQLEELRGRIDRELRSCVICGSEGATRFAVQGTAGSQRGQKASLELCMPCFEQRRTPEIRPEVSA